MSVFMYNSNKSPSYPAGRVDGILAQKYWDHKWKGKWENKINE